MQLDMGLVRDILLHVESAPNNSPRRANVQIEGYSSAQIAYHVYRMENDGLIYAQIQNVVDHNGAPGITYWVQGLTWAGHYSLRNARNNWNPRQGRAKAWLQMIRILLREGVRLLSNNLDSLSNWANRTISTGAGKKGVRRKCSNF